MEWQDELKQKMKRKNQILFSKNSVFLQDLRALLQEENRQVITLWALDFAKDVLLKLEEKYPEEERPRIAFELAKDWASGKVKMPVAKRAILECHAFAKEISNPEAVALCHAIGQACSVVHTTGHAMGLPIYELTSLVHKYGIEECFEPIELRKQEYIDKLFYWHNHYKEYEGEWAKFILDSMKKEKK